MHNFLQGTLKHYGIFVFLLVHTAVILAMESPNHHRSLSPKQGLPLKPDQIVQIFDSKKEVKKGILWDDLIPKNILITPDGKGLILAKRGKVEGFSFDDPSNVKIIIEHPKAKKSFPIIAVSQKKDGLLTIISASNYKNENNEHVAEYILFCNEWTTGKKLDKPIQALSLDSYGKIVAIAYKRSVVVIDLETNYTAEQFFKGIANTDHCIVDVAINVSGTALIAAGSQGSIQWMSISKENGIIALSNLKQSIVGADTIKKIYYPTSEEIIYVTDNGQAKLMTLDGLLTPNNEEAKIADFVKDSYYDQAAVDRYDAATVHWSNKAQIKDSCNAIEVYRKGNNKIEKFILEIPLLDEPYCYIAECGQYAVSKGHLLNVALTDKYVVALATDGNVRIWVLPESARHDIDKKDEKLESEFISPAKEKEVKKTKQRRGRSESDKTNKHSLTSSDGIETGEKKKISPRSEKDIKHMTASSDGDMGKKISPRVIEMFKNSSNSGSRDSSPSIDRAKQGEKK